MSEAVDRRRALSILVGGLTGLWTLAVGAVTAVFVASPLKLSGRNKEILLGDMTSFGFEFRAVKVRIPTEDGWHSSVRQRVVYVRADENGGPDVISGTCTHLACTVRWHPDRQRFICPCHEGEFAPDGTVLAGPPPAPLERIPAFIDGSGNVHIRVPA